MGPELPIDILGGGFTIVPPSHNLIFGRQYELIQGKLDDIDQLPVMRNLEARLYRAAKEVSRERTKKANSPANPLKGMREHDGRNSTLYRAIGRCARQIYAEHGNRDRVFEVAMDLNKESAEPMSTEEVNGVVGNIWLSTTEGRNNIDRRGAFMEDFEIDAMIENDQDVLVLVTFLRRHQGPAAARFMITNSLSETFDWRVERLVAARNRILERGIIRQVKPAWSRSPALYQWRGYMGTPKR